MGVDFSGAAQSGKTAWVAELNAIGTNPPSQTNSRSRMGPRPLFQLHSLAPLGKLAGSDDRDRVNTYLVDRISSQQKTLWGCDFPFGLPIELAIGSSEGGRSLAGRHVPAVGWAEQLSHVLAFDGSAKQFGLSLVAATERVLGAKHVRRMTDRETQTPFDCYHYRIIYQTFHGMRDVLAKIAADPSVAVLPFQYSKLNQSPASSIVVEACPASTLKRLGLPHQRYKQSGGKPPEGTHRETRRRIMKTVTQFVEMSAHRRRVIMQDSGGDALDAVLAGVGAWLGFIDADHEAVARHPRYPREGYVYC